MNLSIIFSTILVQIRPLWYGPTYHYYYQHIWNHRETEVWLLLTHVMPICNGANRGLKAVLHVLNKFGAHKATVAATA